MNKPSYLIPILLCCIYPIAAPLIASWAWNWIKHRDWTNIELPWRKDE